MVLPGAYNLKNIDVLTCPGCPCWLRFGIPAHPSLNMRFIIHVNIVVRGDSEPIPPMFFIKEMGP